MRMRGPGTLIYRYTDENGVMWELEGNTMDFEVTEERTYEDVTYSEYSFEPIARYLTEATYSAQFVVKDGQAFKISKVEPLKEVKHIVTKAVPQNTRKNVEAALDAIKAPANAEIAVGEVDGVITVVAQWTT